MTRHTATARCRHCHGPVTCTPTGHHCPDCGHHDDTTCDRDWDADQQQHGPAGTITLPPALFLALLTAHRRRGGFWRAATHTSPGSAALRELAAAHATGSTRLPPATAYLLAQATSDIDPATWWAVRDLLPLAALTALDAADQAAARLSP